MRRTQFTRTFISSVAVACTAVAVVPAVSGASPTSATALTATESQAALDQASALFAARANPNEAKRRSASSRLGTLSKQDSATSRRLVDDRFTQAVSDYRAWLQTRGEAYVDSSTFVDVLSSRTTQTGAVLRVRETTMLTYAKIRGDEPPETGYSAEHELVYKRSGTNGALTLTKDNQLEPSGLLPLGVAETFTSTKGANAKDQANPAPVVGAEVPSSTEQPSAPSTAKGTAPSLTTGQSALPVDGYNYTAMATYLEKYWTNYNQAYRSFDGVGGDCMNFVSQALRAGGWAMTGGSSGDYHYWWYKSSTQTKSWAAVDWWASYARSSGRTSALGNVWDLRLGDVLQIDRSKDGIKDHTMMVSYYSSKPYFTYHSINRYRRSMDQVLADWGAANYYAYRT